MHLAICSDINILVNNLEYFSCYCLCSLIQILKASLHRGGGPQIGEVTCGGPPHLSCKHNQIKMRDYIDRRVTPPTWGPPPPCKQALNCPKSNWFYEQNNGSARASRFFSKFRSRPLHHYDLKPPNATFYGGREHTTKNFPFSF